MAIYLQVDEFMLSLTARRLSKNTELDYGRTLARLVEWVGRGADPATITARQIEQFLASFSQLSPKSLQNMYVGLSAFWTFLVNNGYCQDHIIHRIKRPSATPPPIVPFTEVEVRRLLDGTVRRPMLRAVIYLLLDTGARASELRDLDIGDVDLRKGEINIRHGKGDKGRVVPFSPATGQAVAKYMAGRSDKGVKDAPLLIAKTGTRLDRRRLTNQLSSLGDRVDVRDVHPHRFRHTFAIQFLRNGGNLFALQKLMGHEQLSTTQRYVRLAQIDVEAAHRQSSPVDNWRL